MFHGVDDMYAMPSPRFFAFAYRLPAYEGMLAVRARMQREDQPERGSTPARSAPSRAVVEGPVVEGAQMQSLASMAFENPDLFERVRVTPDPPAE